MYSLSDGYRFRYPWLRGRVSFGGGYCFRYLWGKGAHLTFLGIVFDTRDYGGVFPLGWVLFSIPAVEGSTPRILGYCFRYPWLCGTSIAHPLCVGIVFNTRGCVGGAYMCGWGKGCRQKQPSAEKSSAEGEANGQWLIAYEIKSQTAQVCRHTPSNTWIVDISPNSHEGHRWLEVSLFP